MGDDARASLGVSPSDKMLEDAGLIEQKRVGSI